MSCPQDLADVPANTVLSAPLRGFPPGRMDRLVHPPPTSPRRIDSVVPFVCALCPAPPVSTHSSSRLPCRDDTPPAASLWRPDRGAGFACSYWEHSHQSWRFKHRRTSPPAPGTTPAALAPCAVSQSLCPYGHVGRTPQRPHPTGYVRDSRPGIVSRTCWRADFGGQNTEAAAYPSPSDVARSAPSPHGLTGKGLMPLSSLSFSRSAFSQQNPGGRSPPASPCHHGKTPDASGVGRT